MSWDHHVSTLRYCRSKAPGSLELTGIIEWVGRASGIDQDVWASFSDGEAGTSIPNYIFFGQGF